MRDCGDGKNLRNVTKHLPYYTAKPSGNSHLDAPANVLKNMKMFQNICTQKTGNNTRAEELAK
jgi:hypothetical protein